jgi:uncharacterized coiled-coil DUF342 family protein
MMEKTTQTQHQQQQQEQYLRIAEKLLRGETLTREEALLLTEREAVSKIYFILHQIVFWGI